MGCLSSEKMLADMKLKGFARSTQEEYLLRARHFAAHYMRSPAEMGEPEIRDYLIHLVNEKKASPASHHMYVASLKFLYATTLNRPEEVAKIPWPKKPRTLPDILSGEEVDCLLHSVHSVKHRAILMSAYGAGLRVSEVCCLKHSDIDSKRMLLHIRHAKNSKDRYVTLSERLLSFLRYYWKTTRPRGEYLFPGRNPGGHISDDGVRWALRKAVAEAGLTKRITPHSLRHNGGVDGRLYFGIPGERDLQSMAIEVKGGKNVSIRDLRALRGVMDNGAALMAGLIIMEELGSTKTRNFHKFMADASDLEVTGVQYPRMQMLTVGEILEGKQFRTPGVAGRGLRQPVLPGT